METDEPHPATPRPPLPRIPDHELIRCIGAGGFGEVWLAAASSLTGVYRAVKLVHRDSLNGDGFQREFRGIQRFEPISRGHPNLVNILHVGQSSETGHFYYVMELGDDWNTASLGDQADENPAAFTPAKYEARTLQRELAQRGALPAEECLSIAMSLTSALIYLHGNNLLHRDIKPANVIFVKGIAKLADIGLVADVKSALTFVGTNGFMPREGLNTPQADIYSLGKVLYEMVTGLDRSLFPQLPEGWAEHPELKIRQQLNQVILRACEDDPARRYSTAQEFQDDLLRVQKRGFSQPVFPKRTVWIIGATTALLIAGSYFFYNRIQTQTKPTTNSQPNGEFVELFNGKDLQNWNAPAGNWACVAGTLQRVRSGGGITYDHEPLPDNFDLWFEWKVAPGSDSGVIYRSGTFEYQILDDAGSPLGKNELTRSGALVNFAGPQKSWTEAVGRWNESRILCEGDRIRHYLNGKEIFDANYNAPEWKVSLDRLRTKYGSDLNSRGGYLVFRDEQGPVWYRHIRLKKLP